MNALKDEESGGTELDKRSTVELFLDLAKESDRWVSRIRRIYLVVSLSLMALLSFIIGIYVPLIMQKTTFNIAVQILIVIVLILIPTGVWYYFLKKFDVENTMWKERISRIKARQEELIARLEDTPK